MKNLWFRTLLIILFFVFVIYNLIPSYQWFFKLSETSKTEVEQSTSILFDLHQNLEKNVQVLREGLNPKYYQIAENIKSKRSNIFIFDIKGIGTSEYQFNLSLNQFRELLPKIKKEQASILSLTNAYEIILKTLKKMNVIEHHRLVKNRSVKLGLDLSGGHRLVLGIDKELLQQHLDQQFNFQLSNSSLEQQALEIDSSLEGKELARKKSQLKTSILAKKKELYNQGIKLGLEQAMVKLSNRINQFGVSETTLQRGPSNTIILEIPGKNDIEQTKSVVTQTGNLSFHLVDEESFKKLAEKNGTQEGFLRTQSEVLSDEVAFYPSKIAESTLAPSGYLPLFKKEEFSGEHLTKANVDYNDLGEIVVSFTLDSQGANDFANVTKNNIGKRLAIVLDGYIQSAPNIQQQISGGSGIISGNFSQKEAKILSTVLTSGSLPVPLKVQEERSIGPSLGKKQVKEGIYAALVALIVLFVFIFFYYGLLAGFIINFSQILGLSATISIMSQLGFAFTLSGVGALVLSIGMNLDSNIIILERVKEVFKKTHYSRQSLDEGYQNAIRTIMDSNLTTFFPALILAVIGYGTIKGFGITLMISLLVNIFSAVFFTHYLYDLITLNPRIDVWKIKKVKYEDKM